MYQNYQDCLSYIYSLVPRDSSKYKNGIYSLDRIRFYLEQLGNPQNKNKVIHVAGTSGKGSTATFISTILSEKGFKVGLTVSPHLLDIRERFQINNKPISEKKFIQYFLIIHDLVEKYRTLNEASTYFEFVIILFYYICWQEKVEYAVVETGLGGLLDATNVNSRKDKVSIITRIGLDHTKVLGSTLSKIAFQKAGIINKYSQVFTILQNPKVNNVIRLEAAKKSAELKTINVNDCIKRSKSVGDKIFFDIRFNGLELKNVELQTTALYQLENLALALNVIEFIAMRDKWEVQESLIRNSLIKFVFQGRMTINHLFVDGIRKTIIADGAHNPQKMAAFIKSLKIYNTSEKIAFVVAFKHGKDSAKMLKYIVQLASRIYLTEFKLQGMDQINISQNSKEIKQTLNVLGYKHLKICKSPEEALNLALQKNNVVVLTGSLYFLSEVYAKSGHFKT